MTPASRISDKVSDQLLQICSRNSARAAIPLLLAILLTWLLLNNKVDAVLLQVWALASCSVILIRVIVLRYIHHNSQFAALHKRMAATALTLILGCTIASVLYFFQFVGTFERAMLTAILLGLTTASHSTNFGYRPLLLSYIGPMLGTLALLWILNIDELVHPALAIAVGVSLLIVGLTLLMNGKHMFNVFALSIESSQKLEEQSHRLSEALRVAEQAKSDAEASSQSKTRFIAAASHDLRQPVHVLNLFGAALKHADLDSKSRDIVDNMNVAVTSLSSQLNALLDISELDSGSTKPNIQSVNLSHLVSMLMLEMKKLAEDKKIELINELPQALFVRTDASMLSQIIRNLCGNAIKYTHTGHVRLRAECSKDTVILSIVDTGIGIDDAESGKVFEEFYQISNPGRDKGRGMGLGLSIVERLVRNLDHKLTLQSKVGQGTEITIAIQQCTRDQISCAHTPISSESPVVKLPPGFWVHLLDNDETVQRSVTAFLTSVGCKVTTSSSSTATLAFMEHNQPSAMLIDLRLNDNDSGLIVVDALKQSHPLLPLALITGESVADGQIAANYPDLLMLQKPVSNDALLELLDFMVIELSSAAPTTGQQQDEAEHEPASRIKATQETHSHD